MKTVTAVLAALAICAVPPALASAKSCAAGYMHAVIGGASKCLRRGEYCAASEKRRYLGYGYECEDVDATYRLEPK
jgi:hypothetical protein